MPPGTDETLVLQRSQPVNQRYYPPHGSAIGATTGLPVEVDHTGSVDLPLIGKVELSGLTIPEATDVDQASLPRETNHEAGLRTGPGVADHSPRPPSRRAA
jgi:protein involved in polysaccharide export with SLBB domain